MHPKPESLTPKLFKNQATESLYPKTQLELSWKSLEPPASSLSRFSLMSISLKIRPGLKNGRKTKGMQK